jgi:hypothetical protein
LHHHRRRLQHRSRDRAALADEGARLVVADKRNAQAVAAE